MRLFISVLSYFTLVSLHASATPLSGIELNNFDTQVRMQDNFYQAVNGNWVKNTVIPADKAAIGIFSLLDDQTQERCRRIIEHDTQTNRSADAQKIRDLYLSFMDNVARERKGIAPLYSQLRTIRRIRTVHDLTRYLGQLQGSPVSTPIEVYVSPDVKKADQNLLYLTQSGLGLPDRDYYLASGAVFEAARQAYVAYLTRLFTLAGYHSANRRAQAVLELERDLANLQWSAVANRDPQRTYNLFLIAELSQHFPAFAWQTFLAEAKVDTARTVSITQPSYLNGLVQLLQNNTLLATWSDYLTARTLDAYAPYLNEQMVTTHFEFHSKALSGATEQSPSWREGVTLVDNSLGEALGKLYVEKHFSAQAKERVERLVRHLLSAYTQSINTVAWMGSTTRAAAQEKLSKYRYKIGYPNRWKDYSSLRIVASDLIGNVQRARMFHYLDKINQLGKPVDRNEWSMTPQTVNAYYDRTMNEIVFPAAILQPPFFNEAADDAVNYGAIGTVIGHEISHGLDDVGSQFDGNGNLREWWTTEDKERFQTLSQKLIKQYAAYQVLPGKYINGELTLGENIADIVGLQIAYKAYQISLNGITPPILDNFTGEQRFFIGFAQIWRNKTREEKLLQYLVMDTHAPGEFRVLGTVTHHDAFYRAFNVQPGDKLYQPKNERIEIW